jgi:hypothetical protein
MMEKERKQPRWTELVEELHPKSGGHQLCYRKGEDIWILELVLTELEPGATSWLPAVNLPQRTGGVKCQRESIKPDISRPLLKFFFFSYSPHPITANKHTHARRSSAF